MLEYVREKKPRTLFVGFGETDEWAHEGRYDLYLRAAHRFDHFVAELWDQMQAMPEYRGHTTFIIATDHGRGDGPTGWRNHGREVDGAEAIWLTVMGPDTPPLGERTNAITVTQSQIAATIASLLGEDFCAAMPQAARPIADVLGQAAAGRP
jgi:phosphopentomutase